MTRFLFLIQKLSYFLRATVGRRLTDITKELDLLVHTLSSYPELNSSIKMEVGIEDCLHIEFEYNKSKYVVALETVSFCVGDCGCWSETTSIKTDCKIWYIFKVL